MARPSITAPTSGASAWCSTKWSRGRGPPQAVRLRVEASPELERIVSKCLETERELRYQHAADLRTDLERLKRGRNGVWSQPPRRRRGRWSGLPRPLPSRSRPPWLAAIYRPRGAGADRQGHDRARRVRQHDRRSSVRRDAPTRTRDSAPAVAVPQPGVGRPHPTNDAVDEPAGGCTADSRHCAGRVRPDRQRGGPGRIDRGAWQSVRPRAARHQLRDWRHPRRRAGTGRTERKMF